MSEAARAFLADYVDGYQELELLVVLAERGGAASLDELARHSRSTPEELATALQRLRATGLVAADGPGGAPRIAIDEPRLPELVALYRRDPVIVLRMLNSLAIERVRLGATRAFADAFLIRRKNRDD